MLINLRNALMAGKRLPYDAEVEYLESTGTQYIDTGIWVSKAEGNVASIRVETDISWTDVSTRQLHGANGGFYFGVVNGYWQNGQTGTGHSTLAVTTNTWHQAKMSWDNGNYLDIDGNTVFQSRSFSGGAEPLTLFCLGSSSKSYYCSCKMGSCKIYDNGVRVRDYIPVRKGAVGYLYDRVSGRLFGNAGTGDFVLGPDVVPVEYIESHGTEYIDTPWTPDLTTDLLVSGRAGFATTGRGMLLSAYNSNSPSNLNISLELYNDFQFRVYAFADVFSRFKCADSVKQMFDYSIVYTALDGLLSCTANGIERSGTVLTQCRVVNTMPARLGADYRATNRYGLFGPVKVYNPVLILDFTPVRVGTGSTWEGAMMDVLTRRIYRNAGTGAFTYGNDLKYPIPAE